MVCYSKEENFKNGPVHSLIDRNQHRLAKTLFVILAVMLSGIIVAIPPSSANAHWGNYGGWWWGNYCCILHIPNHLFTPPNQGTIDDLQNVYPGLNIPSNLIVAPSCTVAHPLLEL
jgi:hypothetical protein